MTNSKDIILKLNEQIENENILENEPMKKHTTFKIGGNADIYVKANTIQKVQHVLKVAKEYNVPIFVIGNGSNCLISDKGIEGIVLKVNLEQIKITKENEKEYLVNVGAGVKLAFLAQKLLKNEIAGFEFASGIPGTIGGAIRMNAGAYGKEMKDIVVSTKYMDIEGKIYEINLDEHEFEYRHSMFFKNNFIILESTFKLQNGNKDEIKQIMDENFLARKTKQPLEYPNAGSTFKRGSNYITAKLIDECGLKGYTIGGASVSTKHAGFVVNTGNATAQDVKDLIKFIQEKVYEKFGEKIETEIEIVGRA